MITTLFRTVATPLAILLDHVMAPRRMHAYLEYVDECDEVRTTDHREVS